MYFFYKKILTNYRQKLTWTFKSNIEGNPERQIQESSAMSRGSDFLNENSQHRASTTAVLELYSASKKISKHWRESYILQKYCTIYDKKMRLK